MSIIFIDDSSFDCSSLSIVGCVFMHSQLFDKPFFLIKQKYWAYFLAYCTLMVPWGWHTYRCAVRWPFQLLTTRRNDHQPTKRVEYIHVRSENAFVEFEHKCKQQTHNLCYYLNKDVDSLKHIIMYSTVQTFYILAWQWSKVVKT